MGTPSPSRVYDETIRVLKSAVQKAKLGRRKSLLLSSGWTNRRDSWSAARGVPLVEPLITEERERSDAYGGRTIFGIS
jgi:hypothetical protein